MCALFALSLQVPSLPVFLCTSNTVDISVSFFSHGLHTLPRRVGCNLKYAFPDEFRVDYGTPVGFCTETSPNVFTRKWTKATVQMDCNTYTGSVTMN